MLFDHHYSARKSFSRKRRALLTSGLVTSHPVQRFQTIYLTRDRIAEGEIDLRWVFTPLSNSRGVQYRWNNNMCHVSDKTLDKMHEISQSSLQFKYCSTKINALNIRKDFKPCMKLEHRYETTLKGNKSGFGKKVFLLIWCQGSRDRGTRSKYSTWTVLETCLFREVIENSKEWI